ncbi:hypothetical protein M430DRAFT_271653, partial [Amorphotheca resinae ATCC 22711]
RKPRKYLIDKICIAIALRYRSLAFKALRYTIKTLVGTQIKVHLIRSSHALILWTSNSRRVFSWYGSLLRRIMESVIFSSKFWPAACNYFITSYPSSRRATSPGRSSRSSDLHYYGVLSLRETPHMVRQVGFRRCLSTDRLASSKSRFDLSCRCS